METKTTPTGEFEEAIKNFSKVSLEVETLVNSGNAAAYKLKNKSIECRNEAIAHEASKRLKSFEVEQMETAKSKESLQTHGSTLEQVFLEEVKLEFDKGVELQKNLLRGNSAINEHGEVENKKSENSEEDSSDSDSDGEDTDDETDTETTDKDSSEEDDDDDEDSSDGNDDSDDETSDDDAKAENVKPEEFKAVCVDDLCKK